MSISFLRKLRGYLRMYTEDQVSNKALSPDVHSGLEEKLAEAGKYLEQRGIREVKRVYRSPDVETGS